MDVEFLARLQFALTIMFHYIYPPLSIGLGVVMVIVEGFYLKSGDVRYLNIAKFWTKIFALTFALGVATGIVMEFEFGTNWSTYSRYVGDVFGSALAAEGVFAFFLESGFLALLLFGWNRVGPKLHFFSTLMVSLGAHFSAIWIVVANSWMQTPAGFKIAGEGLHARAEITSFWEMVFNPSSMVRLSHTITGAWLAAAFLVLSIAAYYTLKGLYPFFTKLSAKIGCTLALIALSLQAYTGMRSAEIVAKHQPLKLAAFEALYHTQKEAPYSIIGIPNKEEQRVDYALTIPGLLSLLAFEDVQAEVKGLDAFPVKDHPNVTVLYFSYRLMIGMWILMAFVAIWLFFSLWRDRLEKRSFLLRCMLISVIFPQIGNQVGWLCAEMGRYPWIVYGHLRISEGLSKSVVANQVLTSIIMFGVVYLFLFAMFIYLLDHKIRLGPENSEEEGGPYHHLKLLVKGEHE